MFRLFGGRGQRKSFVAFSGDFSLQARPEKHCIFEFFREVKYPQFSGLQESAAVLASQGFFSGFCDLGMLSAFRAHKYRITEIFTFYSKFQFKSPSVSSLPFLEIPYHSQQVNLSHILPVDICKIKFRIDCLPDKKI